ncbi:MAG TPA: Txe/YoeB family addiction module toxin [Mucilaginibacter sp.]|nr:Txe/YoeB family addiction module toxin [Mucilaginibacter sp.]
MEIRLIEEAEKDLSYWEKTYNSKVLKRISELLTSMLEDPTRGIGKPEALRHNLSGYWSRRIDKENRIVYRVDGDVIWIVSLRGHYK